MATGQARDTQVVQATGNGNHCFGQSIGGAAELILGNATDLHTGYCVLHPDADPCQAAVVPFLAWLQFGVLRLFSAADVPSPLTAEKPS
jgi:hypothetical protein